LIDMRPADTTAEAEQVQRDAWQRMGPDRRVELCVQMSEDLRQVTLEGLAERHPDATDAELIRRLIQLWHGVDVSASAPPGR